MTGTEPALEVGILEVGIGGSMDRQRPAIRSSAEHGGSLSEDRDTLPPGGGRRASILDTDETAGLVSVLYHAQQGVLAAERAIDDARDANDSELAQFLEATQREAAARADQAKRMLFVRLKTELGEADLHQPHQAAHGRVHYVSVPDEFPSPLDNE
ncbi:MAG: hypothetical protein ABIQ16_21050 [Polyangiaceae bacterium]